MGTECGQDRGEFLFLFLFFPGIGRQGLLQHQEFRKILGSDGGPCPGRKTAGKVILKVSVPVDFVSVHASRLACLMLPLYGSHSDGSPPPQLSPGRGQEQEKLWTL